MATGIGCCAGGVKTQFFTVREPGGYLLRGGSVLPEVTIAFETYGTLNAERDNAILLFHALTGSQHAAGLNASVEGVGQRWTDECRVGWWNDFIGPGKALNTDRFFVVCANYLGGCYGSTGPASINPDTGLPYGGTFPWIGLADIVDSQVRLLDHLGIRKLHAVVGGSLGGMMALSLATRYPDRVRIVVPLASGLRVTMLQRIHGFEQIFAITHDPAFNGGNFYGGPGPAAGLALARMIGHKTFVSLEALRQRARQEVVRREEDFAEYRFNHPVESYMLHQGQKFVKRFDANSYLCLIGLWQSIDLCADAGVSSFAELLSACGDQYVLVFSIDSDVCYYPEEQQELVANLKHCGVRTRHITVHSDKGHDSFLIEPELYMPHLAHLLENGW